MIWSFKDIKITAIFLLAISIGAVYFFIVLGMRIIDPTYISWLMEKGDWSQHFLGWHLFRNESWHFPLGKLAAIEHPAGASIGYTDSIPIMAFLFKPLSNFLPFNFQYIGLWLMICFCLQGLFGALLVKSVSSRLSHQLLGASFFVISPILLARIGHPALCSHWILLAALWTIFRNRKHSSRNIYLRDWLIIVILSTAIHPCITIMTLGLAFAFYLREMLVDRSLTTRDAILSFGILFFASLLTWYAIGYFEIGPIGGNYGSFGYGYFSMNILSPINPKYWSDGAWRGSWSFFLKPLSVASKGQAEGFNYFGVGIFFLSFFAFFTLLARPPKIKTVIPFLPIALVSICFTLIALSNKITLGNHIILELKLNHYLLSSLSPLRSSGRFFWPVYYSTLFILIGFIIRRFSPKISISILTAALFLQLIDFHSVYFKPKYYNLRYIEQAWNSPLKSSRWAEIGKKYNALKIVPPRYCSDPAAASYVPFAYFAAKHGMTINSFYLARYNYEASDTYCNDLIADVNTGVVNPNSVYILSDKYLRIFQKTAKSPIACDNIDGFNVCIPACDDNIQSISEALESIR